MTSPFVAILMGSDSDLPMVEAGFPVLEKFAIRYEVKVTSAHRTPEATAEFVRDADARGCVVFICAAGMAAHLAGAVVAQINTAQPRASASRTNSAVASGVRCADVTLTS